ncbi:putative F-box/FBD/LRR-repeat protein At1g78760 [Silene latifolia]|uniref:putative F-box/FBD/LRR-repeat protein At1g78760 n=1 Tax=Silene latifolia TaxID=37657 RepID=UPI003D76D010
MAPKNRGKKGKQRTNKKASSEQREDKLSALPDDILIGIIARLPLPQAIATGSLSRRWHRLWTNRNTTIQITNRNYNCLLKFFTTFDDFMTYIITSPVIHSFSFEVFDVDNPWIWLPSFDSKLKQICERNVRELKVTFPIKYYGYGNHMIDFPNVVFRTQSLVSVEFCSTHGWRLPESINLPNIKNLTLYFCPSNCDWLEKLTKACPSLEEVSLSYEDHDCFCRTYFKHNSFSIECSHRNLRRLFINFEKSECLEFRINAPKIEYLSVRAPKSMIFTFEEEPIVLREANIEITTLHYRTYNAITSKFYEKISKVRVLSLHAFALDNFPTTLLRKATTLTLDMKRSNEAKMALSSFLELCPLLDALTLKFLDFGKNNRKWILPKPCHESGLPQSLKTVAFEAHWYTYFKPVKSLLNLIEYFLKRATCLEHFCWKRETEKRRE